MTRVYRPPFAEKTGLEFPGHRRNTTDLSPAIGVARTGTRLVAVVAIAR